MSRPSAAAQVLSDLRVALERELDQHREELDRLEAAIAIVRANMLATQTMLDRLGPEDAPRRRRAPQTEPEPGLAV